MTCPACAAAAEGPHHSFRYGCLGCAAREVARGPHYHRCGATGVQDRQYRAQLEQFGVTHQAVREQAQSDQLKQPYAHTGRIAMEKLAAQVAACSTKEST